MGYIKDSQKLHRITSIIASHLPEVKLYYLSELNPRLAPLTDEKDRLLTLFILANADRQSTGKNNESLKVAAATFRQYLSEGILDKYEELAPHQSHQDFLAHLCDIKGMDQKTANLFLKYVSMFQQGFGLGLIDWKSWIPYLHLPLDLWVLRLLGKDYLNICGDQFEKDFKVNDDYASPGFKTNKYRQLQQELSVEMSTTGQSPIVLDILWFVGNKYCGYHPLMCNLCWLAGECVKFESLDWNSLSTQSKTEQHLEHLKFEKKMRRLLREMKEQWLGENPGNNPSDFGHFMQQPEGQKWISEFLAKIKGAKE